MSRALSYRSVCSVAVARFPVAGARTAGAKFSEERELKADPVWLKRERVQPILRDFCSHLMMPWQRCRAETRFASWKCGVEKHAWEECMEHE